MKKNTLETQKKAQQFVDDFSTFKVQCELAGIGGLANPATAKELLDQVVDAYSGEATPILQSLDSCGNGATLLCNLTLGTESEDSKLLSRTTRVFEEKERIKGYEKDGFTRFDSKFDTTEISGINIKENLPMIIRVDIDRPLTNRRGDDIAGSWIGTHSYVFLATHLDSKGEVCGRLIQCYQGIFTIPSFITREGGNPDMSLKSHFTLLKSVVDSGLGTAVRQENYEEAFAAPIAEIDFLIHVKACCFDPDEAYTRLTLLSHTVCQEMQVLCKVAEVAIDSKQLPDSKHLKPNQLWLPQVNFNSVAMRACSKYNTQYLGVDPRQRTLDPFTAIDTSPLTGEPPFWLITTGLRDEYLAKNSLPKYNPLVSETPVLTSASF